MVMGGTMAADMLHHTRLQKVKYAA